MRERVAKLLERWLRTDRDRPGPMAHMFVQDVHASVMPLRARKAAQEFTVSFEGDGDAVILARRTCQFLGRDAYDHQDAAETVSDAVRQIVQYMLWRGYAAFEIGELADVPIGPGRSHYSAEDFDKYFPLEPLSGDRLLRMPGLVIAARRAAPRRWDRDQRLLRVLHPRRIWVVKMPAVLGGSRGYRRIMKGLDRIPQVFPQWATEAVVKQQQDVRFDVAEYGRLRAAYYAHLTGEWAWMGRDTSLNYQTEFFLFFRTLTFHYALAVLREHVLRSLNRLFERELNLNARIVVTGLPSSDDVLAIRKRMAAGELSMGDAFDLTSF